MDQHGARHGKNVSIGTLDDAIILWHTWLRRFMWYAQLAAGVSDLTRVIAISQFNSKATGEMTKGYGRVFPRFLSHGVHADITGRDVFDG